MTNDFVLGEKKKKGNNKDSTLFSVVGVLSIIAGVLCCICFFLIVTIPIGILLIIGGAKFRGFAKLNDDECMEKKSSIMLWAIIICICTFPIGIIALIPVLNLEGMTNNRRVVETPKPTIENKEEQIKKLQEMKDKGLIDDDEFKAAKMKILME